MYVEDLKRDFYEFLTGKRIVVLVHYDIDAVCTCRILQALLRFNHVLYTICVVRGVDDLKNAFRENCEDVKFFLLINCGGSLDIVELLEPDEEITFFVLDSHRPTDLCNIYSERQIQLLWKHDDDNDVPAFEDVFSDDEEEEESGDEEQGENEEEGRATKKRRLAEEAILKRREKRLWRQNRDALLFEYSKFTYYTKASAILMFDLAWKLNKDNKDLLWLAIVALTEQIVFGKIEENLYNSLITQYLQEHASRLQNRTRDTDVTTSVKIVCENDLKLVLYRHWTVEASLKYSAFTACRMKLWSFKGDKKLHELLADMGLPLVQSKQNFASMDLQLRQEFQESLERFSEKYGLADITFPSFTLSFGYRNKYCASDVVYGLLAILENSSCEKGPEENFHQALDCLARSKKTILQSAIENAKNITIALFKSVQSAIDMKQVISAGSFVYFIIQEGCLDWCMFSKPHILLLLARFLQKSYVSVSRNRKAPSLPLIVSAPLNLEKGTCVLLGIPPQNAEKPNQTFFGKVFEKAAEHINCDITCDYLDTSYVELHTRDRTRFFDALTAVLTFE